MSLAIFTLSGTSPVLHVRLIIFISGTVTWLLIIPPYGSMIGISLLIVYCVCVFVCLYGYGFLSAEKDSGVKLRMRACSTILSGMSFSHAFWWTLACRRLPQSLNTRQGGRFLGLRRAKNSQQIANSGKTVARIAPCAKLQISSA